MRAPDIKSSASMTAVQLVLDWLGGKAMDIQSTMSRSMLLGSMEAYVVPNKLPYLPNVISHGLHLQIIADVRDTPVL